MMDGFELVIDFKKDSEHPSRIFRSMASLIDAFSLFDDEIFASLDLPLRNELLLHDIEKGSLKTVLRWALTLPDKDALREGDWKKLLGCLIDDVRSYLLKRLEEEPEIREKKQLEELQEGISKIMERSPTDKLLSLPPRVPLHRILHVIEALEGATRPLQKGDEAFYVSRITG